jgi:hypothetical protein
MDFEYGAQLKLNWAFSLSMRQIAQGKKKSPVILVVKSLERNCEILSISMSTLFPFPFSSICAIQRVPIE